MCVCVVCVLCGCVCVLWCVCCVCVVVCVCCGVCVCCVCVAVCVCVCVVCVCVVVCFVAFFGLAANLFLSKHRAKAVATQAASVSLDMLTHPGLRVQYNTILHNNTEYLRTDRHTAQQHSTAITPTV